MQNKKTGQQRREEQARTQRVKAARKRWFAQTICLIAAIACVVAIFLIKPVLYRYLLAAGALVLLLFFSALSPKDKRAKGNARPITEREAVKVQHSVQRRSPIDIPVDDPILRPKETVPEKETPLEKVALPEKEMLPERESPPVVEEAIHQPKIEVVYPESEQTAPKKEEPFMIELPKHDPDLWKNPVKKQVIWPDRVESWVEYPGDKPRYGNPSTISDLEDAPGEKKEPTGPKMIDTSENASREESQDEEIPNFVHSIVSEQLDAEEPKSEPRPNAAEPQEESAPMSSQGESDAELTDSGDASALAENGEEGNLQESQSAPSAGGIVTSESLNEGKQNIETVQGKYHFEWLEPEPQDEDDEEGDEGEDHSENDVSEKIIFFPGALNRGMDEDDGPEPVSEDAHRAESDPSLEKEPASVSEEAPAEPPAPERQEVEDPQRLEQNAASERQEAVPVPNEHEESSDEAVAEDGGQTIPLDSATDANEAAEEKAVSTGAIVLPESLDRWPEEQAEPDEGEETAAATATSAETGKPRREYIYPPYALLEQPPARNIEAADAELRGNAERLAATLTSFGVEATAGDAVRGPSVTRYEFTLEPGVKLSKVTNLQDDIALALGATGVRVAPIPDKQSVVGIEVPNRTVSPVAIRTLLESPAFLQHRSTTAFAVGEDIGGRHIVGDISRFPHVLIAGTTGSGKSVCTNSLIVSILFKSTPEEVRFIMVDPKMVELAPYNGIPHLLIPVVTDPKKAAGALQWAVYEMMKRYKLFSERGVKDLTAYNELAESDSTIEKLPSVVVVIDELADLMLIAAKEVEESICRVAQMGRAAGMHLVIATQSPRADVITGLMKANIPSRIAFAVASSLESRIILDNVGAEKLVGKGDMLYAPLGQGKPQRVQGCFISASEIERVVSFLKENGEADYDESVIEQIERTVAEKENKENPPTENVETDPDDELFDQAVEVILETGQASTSMLQRRLKLGYSRAARIVDQMEERGIVGPFEGSKPRKILISRESWENRKLMATDDGMI